VQIKIHQFLAEIPFLQKNIAGSDEQHRTIVEAILAGDAARARDVMHAHCDATAALLKGLLT
jgi:GntR family transcriptional repressor for pyruvate dehydrogenase complex